MIASPSQLRAPIPLAPLGLAVVLVYVVLLGGTAIGETNAALRVIGSAVGAVLVWWYVTRAPFHADVIDRGALLALLPFCLAGVLAAFPRQSYDAVLTGVAYLAAFFAARGILADTRHHRLLTGTLIGLSTVMTVVTARLWLLPLLEWWTTTGMVPPLGSELNAFPWGHRHDLALLVTMLYPAWWIGNPSVLRRVAAVAVGVVGVLIVLADGSRALWAAIGLATMLVLFPPLVRWARSRRISRSVVAIVLGAAAVALFVTGIGGALLVRVSSLATLEWRAALWGPLLDSWLDRPVAGSGPGSFAWILQPTGYFDTNSWAPRHPDNALIHMLAEGGLLGLASLGILAVVLVPPLLRAPSASARWALAVFAVGLLGANPSDFAFVIAVAISWAAFALPREPHAASADVRRRPVTLGSVALLIAIGIAQSAMSYAALSYQQARVAVSEGRLRDAGSALDTAATLDPGMALYRRQRGTLRYLAGDARGALDDLRYARILNPADDLAARALALTESALGDSAARDRAIGAAVTLQRSDPTNLLLAAAFAEPVRAEDILAEVVHAWPSVVFSPGWPGLLPPGATTADIIALAVERWAADAPIPELPAEQGVWLVTMAGRADLLPEAIRRSPWSPDLSDALVTAIRCEPTAAAELERLDPGERRGSAFWLLRYRASVLAGAPDAGAARMAAILGSPIGDIGTVTASLLNPLDENDALSADRWGYRRPPISWPAAAPALPSPWAGWMRWFVTPAAAVESAGLLEALPLCGP